MYLSSAMTSGEQSSLDFVIFSFCQEHVYIFVEMHVICVQSNEMISLENNKSGKDPSYNVLLNILAVGINIGDYLDCKDEYSDWV